MKTVLLVGTYDTKQEELAFLEEVITAQGAQVLSMDVSVLGNTSHEVGVTKHDVAAAAGQDIQSIIDLGDEYQAMCKMAEGASALTLELFEAEKFDGLLVLGGSMGTDLALDCAASLPLGIPKYIVSTISFSPLIETSRIAPDVQMILWAGGLYGLNSVCKSSLSQAAGAVVGACHASVRPTFDRPMIGMVSLGKSCLQYMAHLKPELEARGFELVVFHATGMGGRAFEGLAAKGMFVCVFDFCMQELTNAMLGSVVSAGDDRLTNAGAKGIPQLVAPGASDLVDFPSWHVPEKYQDREIHPHNRLISSSRVTTDERRLVARAIGERLKLASGPVTFLMPTQGIEEWDRPGQDMHDPEGLSAFVEAAREAVVPPVNYLEIDAHINDVEFSRAALEVFDDWLARGIVRKG
jgi:uncharacterized protein (UPF0261 family)